MSPPGVINGISRAREMNIPVVITSRCQAGPVRPYYTYEGAGRELERLGCIFAPYLTGPKARIKLPCSRSRVGWKAMCGVAFNLQPIVKNNSSGLKARLHHAAWHITRELRVSFMMKWYFIVALLFIADVSSAQAQMQFPQLRAHRRLQRTNRISARTMTLQGLLDSSTTSLFPNIDVTNDPLNDQDEAIHFCKSD